MLSTTFLKALWLVALFNGHPVTLYPTQSEGYVMRQGFYNCEIVWYVPFAASDPLIAKQLDEFARKAQDEPLENGVEWTLALNCALEEDVLGDVYFINCAQTTIFSTQPGEDDYTPLWRVHYLEWAPGVTPRPLCNETDVQDAITAGELLEQGEPSVLDATIVIPTSGKPSVELAELEFDEREVEFYAFPVYYFDKVNRQRQVRFVIAPDISDESLAERLGANHAARLVNSSPDCCGRISAFENPIPVAQLPIISEVPSYPYGNMNAWNRQNINFNYNPVLCWELYERTGLAPYAVVNSDAMVQRLLGFGLITEIPLIPPIVSNSPVTLVEFDAN
ncbi:MAG: DUF7482 domain-containing protein [Armatimonadota bacterium]